MRLLEGGVESGREWHDQGRVMMAAYLFGSASYVVSESLLGGICRNIWRGHRERIDNGASGREEVFCVAS